MGLIINGTTIFPSNRPTVHILAFVTIFSAKCIWKKQIQGRQEPEKNEKTHVQSFQAKIFISQWLFFWISMPRFPPDILPMLRYATGCCLPPFDAAQILQATPLRWAAVSFGRRAGAMSKEKKSAEKQEQPHHQQMPCVIAPWENWSWLKVDWCSSWWFLVASLSAQLMSVITAISSFACLHDLFLGPILGRLHSSKIIQQLDEEPSKPHAISSFQSKK